MKKTILNSILIVTGILTLGSCRIAQKIDSHVAASYSNTVPSLNKKKTPGITVASSVPFEQPTSISRTVKKRTKVLPLIVYIHMDYRHTTTLNPAIALSSFSNTISQQYTKLSQKLNGQQLDLVIEQVPHGFSLVDKSSIIFFFITLQKLYVEPDKTDLVVSYKVSKDGTETKSGNITVKTEEKNTGVRFGQSVKSSTTEYIARYNANLTAMGKNFINQLLREL